MKYITEIFLLLFLALTFIQSGYDKIVDWKGNVTWLKSHFANTFLADKVPFSLGIILILEIIIGPLALAAIWFLVNGSKEAAVYTGIISCITLLLLLYGQRVAKDYDGARTIVIYFIPTIFLLFLLQ